ncbi:MAG: apolipoprotein N-acyltransferase [Bacteroidetes bacterium]|nr:MAG: apolipoprotein N-acyltransferase [Bacteroidota bacterium]
MKKSTRLLLALLSGILLSIPFYMWGSGLVMMVAFVPLLFVEDAIAGIKGEAPVGKKERKDSVVWYAIIAFAIFNILTSYWVRYAAWVGIIASTIVGTIYMTLVFWLFHLTRRRLGDRLGYTSLVVYWITFEFLYLRAQINFPWLVLGNSFAHDVILIQWYEVTGHLGGTLWALLMNVTLFLLIRRYFEFRSATQDTGSLTTFAAIRGRLSRVVGIFLIPSLISVIRYMTYEEKADPYEIVILQPNIDPYMKFVDMPQEEQTTYLLQIADSLVRPQTDYIVGPETFLNNFVWEETIHHHPDVVKIRGFLEKFPRAKMVLGATTYLLYTDPSEYTVTSRPFRNENYRFDSFNSAFQLDSSGRIPIYHKSKLVVGVEHMPYTHLLGFLENLTVKLGGAFRSHGTQEYREAFESPQDGTRVGPVICWESIFGEFVTGYVREAGADFLFIVTNDGWWRNTPGHKQHNVFARLRAIETRRSIARSANTGISSFINQRGDELERIGWWQRSGIRGTLNKNDHLTFYTRYGDYIGRISLFVTLILLLYTLVVTILRK